MVVDTSVWIDYFNGTINRETDFLDQQLTQTEISVGDLILLEVLQGFKFDKDYLSAKQSLMALDQHQFLDTESAICAADHFRQLRKNGITIRKTNDVIIASYCITHDLPLLFTDKDFLPFVEHLGLIPAIYG